MTRKQLMHRRRLIAASGVLLIVDDVVTIATSASFPHPSLAVNMFYTDLCFIRTRYLIRKKLYELTMLVRVKPVLMIRNQAFYSRRILGRQIQRA